MDKELPEICKIQYGYAFDSASFSNTEGIPLIRIRDVVRGYSETYTTEECSEEYIVNNGDMLIGMDGEFNIARWNGGKAYLNQRVCRLIPTDEVDEMYLYYFMPKALKAIEDKTPFVTVKHLSAKELNRIVVPIPTIEEQKEIANSLQGVDELISLRKQQLSKLDELVKSRFIELFGDPETNPYGHPIKKLSEIASYWNGLTYKPEDVQDQGTIVLRSSNIQNSQLDFEDTVRVACRIREKQYVQNNDILMCSRNGSAKLVGKVALITNITEPMSFGAFMMIIRSDYYRYLMAYFQMDAFRNQIKTGATTTINQITGNMLNQVTLPVPDLSVVSQFAAFVEQIDKSKFEIQKSLKKLETLKKALMQKYFG